MCRTCPAPDPHRVRGFFLNLRERSRRPPARQWEHRAVAREKIGQRTWTTEEERQLRQHSQARTPLPVIAKKMQRTVAALRARAVTLGIGLGHRRPRGG